MEAQRYPIGVRLIGVMLKEKSKVYMASVLWSDQNDIVIYRTLQDFKTMHHQLKKAFPAATKKKSDRVIPRFQDKKMKSGKQRRGPNKSLVQLKRLQKYCNELLRSDLQVCKSANLIQFFHPRDQDLQPEFAKNSIMIMPSEDEMKTEAGPANIGNVTQPFVTETYRCVAAYETKDTMNKPFKVAMDEKVDVLIKDKAGWWLVEKEDKRMAWFPAPYLEKVDDDDDDDDDEDDMYGTPERGMLYTAVKSYKATKDDEISVPIGAVVELLQKSNNGWSLMSYNGESGYIPTMYLQPYGCPLLRLMASHHEFRAPSPRLERKSHDLAGSQGSLMQPPPARCSSPSPMQRPPARCSSPSPMQPPPARCSSPSPMQPPPARCSSPSLMQPPPARCSSPSLMQPPPARCSSPSLMQPPPARCSSPSPMQRPPARCSSPSPMQPDRRQISGSLNIPTEDPLPAPKSASSAPNVVKPAVPARHSPAPTTRVEITGDDEGDDFASSSSEFSFSDDDLSSDGQSLNEAPPLPWMSNHLRAAYRLEGKMAPSVSDPNLFKGPASPRVPPRPRAQEILTRCSTITRKNATKAPKPTESKITLP